MNTSELRDRLREVLGADNVVEQTEALAPYASDYTEEPARQPLLVARPASTEEVQAVVRLVGQAGGSLTTRVSGSNVGGLTIPPDGGIVIDLSRMDRIVDVSVDDMVAVLEPGVTWEQLTAYIDERELPLRMGYPLSPPDTSIMANCLLDGLGNLSMRYGAMADWIGGLEAVLPDGSLVRTGAAALSDVWFGRGPLPDLTGLFVSWQGTTGIVTRMAFQLWPKPPHRKRMFLLTNERNAAFEAMRTIARAGLCDDVGGLSWPMGKMLFGVERPLVRDPGEPEFFLYLDVSGESRRELALRLELLDDRLGGLRKRGHDLAAPIDVETLVALVPRLAKLATFPTRLDFLVDHPGRGLSWVGTYGPMSRFEAYADRGLNIMAEYRMSPCVVSRPMKGGHFGVMRFLTTFYQDNRDEARAVREMNERLVDVGLELGFIPYKTPPWAVRRMRDRLDPGFVGLMRSVRQLLDPGGVMAPHCWPLD
jgi:FAD/FMN-containing dehydrogenase